MPDTWFGQKHNFIVINPCKTSASGKQIRIGNEWKTSWDEDTEGLSFREDSVR
jgi:hypothetical protein